MPKLNGMSPKGSTTYSDRRKLSPNWNVMGHDTREAMRLLDNFVLLQAAHVADRDRLRAELAKAR